MKDLSKRKEFYLSTDVWNKGLSCHAKAVLAYLSYCANKQGECFPSIQRIARECSICKNTVRKAIEELKAKGMLCSSERIVKGEYGAYQTSNLYTLLTSRGLPEGYVPKGEGPSGTLPEAGLPEAGLPEAGVAEPALPAAAAPKQKPPVRGSGEGGPVPISDDPDGDAELEDLLARLDIRGLYYDKAMGKALELAIRELWYAESFRYKGEHIPTRRIRMRLLELDVDAIDSVIDAIASHDKRDVPAFMKACLYEAPLKASAITAAQICERQW